MFKYIYLIEYLTPKLAGTLLKFQINEKHKLNSVRAKTIQLGFFCRNSKVGEHTICGFRILVIFDQIENI